LPILHPSHPERQKTKRGKENYLVELKPTKDIAAELGALKKPGQILTGFALETNNEMEMPGLSLKRRTSI
jgi:phosphopantothenoylcysteine decarboxylase / phosphopantothenate---cysteine ligase